jgi:hypothetical protein
MRLPFRSNAFQIKLDLAAIASILRNCAAELRSRGLHAVRRIRRFLPTDERYRKNEATGRAILRNFKPKPANPTRQGFRRRYRLA